MMRYLVQSTKSSSQNCHLLNPFLHQWKNVGFWTFFNDYSIRKHCLLLTSSLPQNLTWPFWVIVVKVIAEKTVLSEERNQ
jgi:hypothetical protein